MLSINLRPDSDSWWDRFKARHLVSRNIRRLANRGEIQIGLCEIADKLGCPVTDEGHPLYVVYRSREDLLKRGFKFVGVRRELTRA